MCFSFNIFFGGGFILFIGRSRNSDSKQNFTKELMFGATCQEVAGGLGAPNKVFYKSEDKMKIHNARARKAITRSDCFFNYFTLGLVSN